MGWYTCIHMCSHMTMSSSTLCPSSNQIDANIAIQVIGIIIIMKLDVNSDIGNEKWWHSTPEQCTPRNQSVRLTNVNHHIDIYIYHKEAWTVQLKPFEKRSTPCMYISFKKTSFWGCIHDMNYMFKHRCSGPERRSSGGNTSSAQQASALVPRTAFTRVHRMCQRHGSDKTAILHTLVLNS